MEPVKSADRDIPLIADANALADYLQGGPTAANGAKSRGDVPTLKQWLARNSSPCWCRTPLRPPPLRWH